MNWKMGSIYSTVYKHQIFPKEEAINFNFLPRHIFNIEYGAYFPDLRGINIFQKPIIKWEGLY